MRRLNNLEDSLSVVALLSMALIPLLEITIRQFYPSGIPGSDLWVQHLVLWVAFLGAAIAARRGELLSLSTAAFLKGRTKRIAEVITGGVGAAICVALARGSWALMTAEREGGALLGFGVPVWIAQSIMPVGFAVIGLRILLRTSPHWKLRWIAQRPAGTPGKIPRAVASSTSLPAGRGVLIANSRTNGPSKYTS